MVPYVSCYSLTRCRRERVHLLSLPYSGQTQDADVFIDIPNLRQYGGYTCGTTCVQMVMILLSG